MAELHHVHAAVAERLNAFLAETGGLVAEHARRPGLYLLAAWSQTLTDELLEVLWVLEATLRLEPELDEILALCRGDAAAPAADQ